MKKTITPIAIAVCAVLVLATGAAIAERDPHTHRVQPGREQDAPAGCSRGALCVYEDADFGGRRYQFFGTNRSWARWRINNNDSSAYNNGRTGMAVEVYNTAWRGSSYCLRKGHGYRWVPQNYGSANRWRWGC